MGVVSNQSNMPWQLQLRMRAQGTHALAFVTDLPCSTGIERRRRVVIAIAGTVVCLSAAPVPVHIGSHHHCSAEAQLLRLCWAPDAAAQPSTLRCVTLATLYYVCLFAATTRRSSFVSLGHPWPVVAAAVALVTYELVVLGS